MKDKPENDTETEEKEEKEEKERHNPLDEFGNQVEKFAVRTAESIKKVVDKALASRNTVLTIRVNDESNQRMNMLVDAGLFKSRSESAAFLIQEGIRGREDLFAKIEGKLKKMDKIKDELRSIVSEEMDETA